MSESKITVELEKIAGCELAAYAEPGSEIRRLYLDGKPASENELFLAVGQVFGCTVGRVKMPKVKAKAATGAKRGRKPKAQAPEAPPVEPPAQ